MRRFCAEKRGGGQQVRKDCSSQSEIQPHRGSTDPEQPGWQMQPGRSTVWKYTEKQGTQSLLQPNLEIMRESAPAPRQAGIFSQDL